MAYISLSNEKMKKSSDSDKIVCSFGIPPIMTCPNACACKNGCYATMGRYLFSNVKNKLRERYDLSKTDLFVPIIDGEIKTLVAKNPDKTVYVRIHDTGDFYDMNYTKKWLKVMSLNPSVRFYAYTKMVTMFNGLKASDMIPLNFNVIYSYGGTEDDIINPDIDKNARVFESIDDLTKNGYIDCSTNDLLVFEVDKVGLVYHGSKKFINTGFNQN